MTILEISKAKFKKIINCHPSYHVLNVKANGKNKIFTEDSLVSELLLLTLPCLACLLSLVHSGASLI